MGGSKMKRPFVGPTPYTESDKDRFFGRDADVVRLRSILRAERIVVLHAPSGAGKTSLIQAGLVPALRKDEVTILPAIRVGLPLIRHEGRDSSDTVNPYSESVVRSLEEGLSGASSDSRSDAHDDLNGIPLTQYFAHRSALQARSGAGRLLVFDQFEDIFIRSPHDHAGRVAFFRDLAEVLRDKSVWALFAMREEYVAALDRYKRLLPAQLAARYHLDYLSPRSAREAIVKPFEAEGRGIRASRVDELLRDLADCGPDRLGPAFGPKEAGPLDDDIATIDPLHLQLVCVDEWARVDAGPGEFRSSTATAHRKSRHCDLSPVDQALLRFYDRAVSEASDRAATEPERLRLQTRLRSWIDDELIEAGSFRRQAIPRVAGNPGLADAISGLEDEHILRVVFRVGTRWYEVAHDRMVGPIRRSNDSWYARHLDRFQHNARRYREEGYPPRFEMIGGGELKRLGYALETTTTEKLGPLAEHEQRYLRYCRDRIRSRRRQWLAWAAAAVLVLVALAVGLPWFYESTLEPLEKQKADLERKNEKLKRENEKLQETRDRAAVRRIFSRSMTECWRNRRHDTALLLAKIAVERNRGVDRKPLLSPTFVNAALWASLEASPFSQSLPAEVFEGHAVSLEARDFGFMVLAKAKSDQRLEFRIDLESNHLKSVPLEEHSLFSHTLGGQSGFLSADGDTLELRDRTRSLVQQVILDGEITGLSTLPKAKQDYVAVTVLGGRAALYKIDDASITPWTILDEVQPVAGAVTRAENVEPGDLTAATFQGDVLLAGTSLGRVFSRPLAPMSPEPRFAFDTWLPCFPFPHIETETCTVPSWTDCKCQAELGHPGVTRHDARVVGIRRLAIGDDERVLVVHKGGFKSRGGRVMLYSTSDPIDGRWQLVPDEASITRERVMRESGQLVDRSGGEQIADANFSASGRWLVTGGTSGGITVWDLQTIFCGEMMAAELGHVLADEVSGLEVRVCRAARTVVPGSRQAIRQVGVSPDGRFVGAIDDEGAVLIWRMRGARELARVVSWGDRRAFNYGLAFDDDEHLGDDAAGGVSLFTTNNRGAVEEWRIAPDVERSKVEVSDTSGDGVWALIGDGVSIRDIDVDGDLVAVAAGDFLPRVFARESPGPPLALRSGATERARGVWSVALSRGTDTLGETRLLASGHASGRLFLWRIKQGTDHGLTSPEHQFIAHAGAAVSDVAFDPSGRWLVGGLANGSLCVIDTARAIDEHRDYPVATGAINAVAFSVDGDRLAIAGEEGVLMWWRFSPESDPPFEVRSGHLVPGIDQGIRALAFLHGDSRSLASASRGVVQIWDLDEGTSPLRLRGTGAELHSLAASRDGFLAAGDSSGRFKVWDLKPAKYVCSLLLGRGLTRREWNEFMRNEEFDELCGSP
jgi:WD40 repeat protein